MGGWLALLALVAPGPGLAMRAGILLEPGLAVAPMTAIVLLLIRPAAPTAAAVGMALMAPAVLALGGLTSRSHQANAWVFAALLATIGAGFLALSRWIGGQVPALRFRGATLAGVVLTLLGAVAPAVVAVGLWRHRPGYDLGWGLRLALGFLPLVAAGAAALVHHPGRGRRFGQALAVIALAWLVITVAYVPHWPARA
jgi:hypothetical protein